LFFSTIRRSPLGQLFAEAPGGFAPEDLAERLAFQIADVPGAVDVVAVAGDRQVGVDADVDLRVAGQGLAEEGLPLPPRLGLESLLEDDSHTGRYAGG
jgi:hypothetical protein